MPPCSDLCEFVDLQAHDSENSLCNVVKKHRTTSYPDKRMAKSYTPSVVDNCVSCRKDSHPFYRCKSFIALSPDKRMDLIWDSRLCINYLKLGHFVRQCPSPQKCKKSQGSHHSLVHKESTTRFSQSRQSLQSSETREDPKVVTTHTSQSDHQRQVLLNTCQVIVVRPDGASFKARALLDSDSLASFISERV